MRHVLLVMAAAVIGLPFRAGNFDPDDLERRRPEVERQSAAPSQTGAGDLKATLSQLRSITSELQADAGRPGMLPDPARLAAAARWLDEKYPSATGKLSERVLVRVAGQKEVVLDLPVP
jgi:hypothetical protein